MLCGRTVALKVTQVNDFDINLFMHNGCVFGSRSSFIPFKSFLTRDGSKNIARNVHPAVDLLPGACLYSPSAALQCISAHAQTEPQQVEARWKY